MSDSYIPQDQPKPAEIDPSITAPDPSLLIDDNPAETVPTEFDTVARLLPGVETFPIDKSLAPEEPKAYRNGFFDSKTVGLGALFADLDAVESPVDTPIAPGNNLFPRLVGVERIFDELTADEMLSVLRGAPKLWDEFPDRETEYQDDIIPRDYSLGEVSKTTKKDTLLDTNTHTEKPITKRSFEDNGTLSHKFYPKAEHETTDWQTSLGLDNNILTSPLPEPLPGVRAEFRVVKDQITGKIELVRVPIVLELPANDSTTAKSEPDTTEQI